MNALIEKFINNMSLYDIQKFAISNDVFLSNNELSFIYEYVKNNWKEILNNKGIIDMDKYREYFSNDNFDKIKKLINIYRDKYSFLLK